MRLLITKAFRSQQGLSLIEVIIGAAIVALTAVAVPQLMKLIEHNSSRSQAIRVSVTERTKIEAYLKNHAAWTQTLQKNPSFACGINNTPCSANVANNGFYDFVIYTEQPNEKLSYDATDMTTRLTLQGVRCPPGIPDPSERCPIRFQASWKPLCAVYPCVNPTVQIQVTLSTRYGSNPTDLIAINAGKYSYSIVRSFNEDDIQSACFMLNGTYNTITNTCLPPHAGQTCALLGRPAQVVSAVNPDGSIVCSPFFHNSCNPATEMMTGILANGAAVCGLQPPPTPVIDCIGNWGPCSAACNGGSQTFTITTPASGGGAACPFVNGATQACNPQPCPVNCVGGWQACTQLCGGGTSTFVVTTAAANGGAACIASHGDVMACNTQACVVPVDCAGFWNACDTATGTEIFTVNQVAQNGGAACPASPRNCSVDCVGNWGACNAGSRTYSWSITPKNGGSACPYANGATEVGPCGAPFANGVCNPDAVTSHCGFGTCNVSGPICLSGIASPAFPVFNNGNCGTTAGCPWTCLGTGGGATVNCFKPSTGSSCFTSGTRISMADGSLKNIEQVQVGDLLKGSVGPNQVRSLKRYHHEGDLYSVNGSEPFVTAGHPFMTLRGWAAFDEHLARQLNPSLEIVRLEVGDVFILDNGGRALLSEFYAVGASTTVYNFEVSGTRDYFAEGFLVHNK